MKITIEAVENGVIMSYKQNFGEKGSIVMPTKCVYPLCNEMPNPKTLRGLFWDMLEALGVGPMDGRHGERRLRMWVGYVNGDKFDGESELKELSKRFLALQLASEDLEDEV